MKVADAKSNKRGQFAFRSTIRTVSTTYRVEAPAVRLGGRKLKVLSTPARKITTESQSGSLDLPTTADQASTISVATVFTPPRPGRPVELQMKTPRGWEQVATAPQSTVGGAKFLVPTEAVGSFDFRAMTAPFNGASAVTTAPRTLEVTATPPTDITPPAVPTGVVATPGNG
ncbi:hypothetical protein, partial [Nocardioides aquaticus]